MNCSRSQPDIVVRMLRTVVAEPKFEIVPSGAIAQPFKVIESNLNRFISRHKTHSAAKNAVRKYDKLV